MKNVALALIVALVVPICGCGEKKSPPPAEPAKTGVDVQAPGVEVKAGEGGVEVKTPAADVEVNK